MSIKTLCALARVRPYITRFAITITEPTGVEVAYPADDADQPVYDIIREPLPGYTVRYFTYSFLTRTFTEMQ